MERLGELQRFVPCFCVYDVINMKCSYNIFQEFGLEWSGMILREENMMVPMKERSILNAGEFIPGVNMSCTLAKWPQEIHLLNFYGKSCCYQFASF